MTKQLFRLTLFCLICLTIPVVASAQVVFIPDFNLRAVIEDHLGLAPGATITVADMATLTELDASNRDISDVTGLEAATNLTTLDLGAQFYEYSSVNSNTISDLSPLAGLTNLTELWLRKNSISNISAVIGLTNLEALDLGTNSISDLSPLAGLTNLTTLVLRRNSISDISPVAGLTDLTWLDLGDNPISDIVPLAGLTQLTHLGLWDNAISDISPLVGLTQLILLWLNNNTISDITPLAGLTQLTELNLINNSISDLAPLVANTGLGSEDAVDVKGNPLDFLSIVTYIPTLQSRGATVYFDNIIIEPPEDLAQPVDIPDPNLRAAIEHALGKAPSATITEADMLILTELFAPSDNISDLTGLEAATNLTWLELGSNNISDISALARLTQLTQLGLGNNYISDLSPLVENTGIGSGDYVSVKQNFLNAESINTHIPTLQGRGVIVEFDNIIVRPEDIAQIVDIPDPNLRTQIEYERAKPPGTPITVADMLVLTELAAHNSNISDLTGLEYATNLTELDLDYNNITDISPLAGLTHLTELRLNRNFISDLSPLVENAGLRFPVDSVSVTGNPLNAESINTHIPELQSRQVRVWFDNIIIERPEDLVRPVNMPDPNLRAAIGSRLRIPRGEPITLLDMLELIELHVPRHDISDLTGLEHAINLRKLWLVENNITDISPLTGLTNLTILDLINNSISDISPLAGLTNLTEIGLRNNSISDLSPLVANTGMGRGDSVDVTGNPLNAESINTHIPTLESRRVTITFVPRGNIGPIVDIPDPDLREALENRFGKLSGDPITESEMATLVHLHANTYYFGDLTGLEQATNLRTLSLRENKISDISPLAGLTNLIELNLERNRISDISPLVGLTNLTELKLTDNRISDISPIAGLTNLIELRLGANVISDTSPLAGLNNVTRLDIGRNKIVDISPLAGLTNLITLLLWENTISDILPIAGLNNLTELALADNRLSDISPIAGLNNLEVLDLGENTISDISPIAGLNNLEALGLGENSISDISPIAGLTQLLVLSISSNPISDISILAGLINLTQIWLGTNSISDISPLVANTGLGSGDIVDLRGNPLNFLSINTHIPALLSRDVDIAAYDIVVRPEDIAQTVDISDPNLRATIAAARGKAVGDTITVADMLILIELKGINANISDLTGLEAATNLTELWLPNNNISDLSPIAGLTQLTNLWLDNNSISDLSPLVANAELGSGDQVDVAGNFLNEAAINTHIPALQSRGVTIEFDNIIVRPEDIAQTVDIPDPNLRSAIKDERGKASGYTITVADMLILDELSASNANISDLTGLEHASNLTELWFENNSISDISPLAGLTQLTYLHLEGNSISDISAIAGLTDLIALWINNNTISDISPLVENTGLGYGDFVDVRRNPLNLSTINTHIPMLQGRWVTVEFDNIVAQTADVNGDGVVNIFDLVSVARMLGHEGQNLTADVNGDGAVSILDLVLVAGTFDAAAAAPSAHPQAAEMLTAAAVRQWLTDAKALEITDPIMERGIVLLQQLLISLTPTETMLLPNYPNPFNPETWIPYRLAEDAFVTLTIYDGAGQIVRTLDVGHQAAAVYESRSKAIYWDGRNRLGEQVASGVYFYHLSAGDYSATRKMLILK